MMSKNEISKIQSKDDDDKKQLSMNIDPEIKKRIKIMSAIQDISMTELILEYIKTGLEYDEKKYLNR
jgi:predicted HicB family RNase H-like nuclease